MDTLLAQYPSTKQQLTYTNWVESRAEEVVNTFTFFWSIETPYRNKIVDDYTSFPRNTINQDVDAVDIGMWNILIETSSLNDQLLQKIVKIIQYYTYWTDKQEFTITEVIEHDNKIGIVVKVDKISPNSFEEMIANEKIFQLIKEHLK